VGRNKEVNQEQKLNILQKFGRFFYDQKVFTVLLWTSLVVFGAVSYTSLMKREGFPSVNVALGVVQINSFSESAKQADELFAQPLVELLNQNPDVKSVSATSTQSGSTLVVTFEGTEDVQPGLDDLQAKSGSVLPENTAVQSTKLNAGKLTEEGEDLLISVHTEGASAKELDAFATELAQEISKSGGSVESARIVNLVQIASNASSGQETESQITFNRFFSENTNQILPSAIVAVKGVEGVDQLELYDQIDSIVQNFDFSSPNVEAEISVNFAEGIREQVDSLQTNLLEGLLVVLVVSFLLISLRASIITALAMATTVAITVGILNLIGYSLNTITLFSLVLCLALIVDDTTIVVEAMDAGLKDKKAKIRQVAISSLGKIARASTTGTLVTILAFAPMLFITGILGEFIRAIPVTIIISLVVSLVVSLIFIPLMMKLSFFGSKETIQKQRKIRIFEKLEHAIASGLSRTVEWSTAGSRVRSVATKLTSVAIGSAFLMAGFYLFSQVGFNIFPNPKDGNDLTVVAQVRDLENSTIEKTEAYADTILQKINDSFPNEVEKISISEASPRSFTASVRLIDYGKRDITSVEIADQLNSKLTGNTDLNVTVAAAGVGPPTSPFVVQLSGEDEEAVRGLAGDMKVFLEDLQLNRLDGTTTDIKEVSISPSVVTRRSEDSSFVEVTAEFTDNDTSTLVLLAQTAIEEEFTPERLASYGLSDSAIRFDLGQEQENQDSFSSMGTAALPLFATMFIVMALLFKSLLQPVLIFTALPFAFFGVALGLFVTDNVISFFSMLGVFALIGISLNNTILLTDYANAAQRRGKSAPDAMAEALQQRLRPLLTTSVTSVLALLPLALNDPFWEGLAFTLIFGLISSTILVLIVFPYYYLIAEALRSFTKDKLRKRKKATA
jgi:multidrug efflux pump subunit AcrB